MNWNIEFHEDFADEFEKFSIPVQDNILVKVKLLQEFGA